MGGWGQAREGPGLPGKVREGGGRAEFATQGSNWGGGAYAPEKGDEAWLFPDPSADMLDLGERWGSPSDGGLERGKKEGKETD